MEYLALITWCFLVALAGGVVGLVLGNIRLPVVLLVASSPAVGAGTNIAISAVAAATAGAAHIRAGRVNWRLFAWMAPPSILGAAAGGLLSGALPGDVLLAAIACVLLYSAYDLFGWERPARPAAAPSDPPLDLRAAVLSGALIGLLGGVVGLILGSLRMPALLGLVGETPQRAVGTNLAVGVLVGVAGALAHLPSAPPDPELLLLGGAASIPGALLGARLTGRLSERQLIRAIACVLVVAALGCGVQAVV